jgi:hypothetical protein
MLKGPGGRCPPRDPFYDDRFPGLPVCRLSLDYVGRWKTGACLRHAPEMRLTHEADRKISGILSLIPHRWWR